MRKLIFIIFVISAVLSCSSITNEYKVNEISTGKKFRKIDKYIADIQAGLPDDDGSDWIWVSASRKENLIIFEYEASKNYDGRYDHENQKNGILDYIKKEPEIVSDQMNFRFIYNLPDGKIDVINISPKDYD